EAAVLGGPGFELPAGEPSWMALDRNGTRLAVPCGGSVLLFDTASSKLLETFPGPGGRVYTAALRPDGKRLAAGLWGENPLALVWDAEAGTELFRLTGHTDKINRVAYSPDGKWIATASSDGTARLWDADKGTEAHTLRGGREAVYVV